MLLVDTGIGRLQLAAGLLAAAEGAAGLWIADSLTVGPGAALAVLSGGVFALVALWRWAR